ncbi:hypothetical protein ACFX2H_012783 [Malus domestica]
MAAIGSDFNGTSASDSFVKTPTIKCIQLFINGELLDSVPTWTSTAHSSTLCSSSPTPSTALLQDFVHQSPIYSSSSTLFEPSREVPEPSAPLDRKRRCFIPGAVPEASKSPEAHPLR